MMIMIMSIIETPMMIMMIMIIIIIATLMVHK